jgi:hypothetical protein
MKLSFYICSIALLAFATAGCRKDNFNDTSFVSTAVPPSGLAMLFAITQDNTGLVTITPSGTSASTYDIYYGDTAGAVSNIFAGNNATHKYAEGAYTVKMVAHNVKGDTASFTQPLTVSFRTPEDLQLNVSTSGLTVSVGASATYATFFRVFYGDSTASSPVLSVPFMAGQTLTHTYSSAGTYVVTVVALSGGAETTQSTSTIYVANPINLPVTFEDPTVDYTMGDFGGEVSVLTTDPTNAANHVMQSTKTAGAVNYAGVTIGTGNGFATAVPLSATVTKMTVRVYSPAVGIDVKLKLDDHTRSNAGFSVETDVLTTVANQWETLTFDFSHPAPTTPAWNPSYTYDLATIFFDFNVIGNGATYYFDDVQMAP